MRRMCLVCEGTGTKNLHPFVAAVKKRTKEFCDHCKGTGYIETPKLNVKKIMKDVR